MIRVLIVEDHPIVRRGLKEALADEFPDLTVGEAEDSTAGLDLAINHPWDIIIIDINIPGRGGLEVLSEIRRASPTIPVLVLSQYPEEEFAFRSFKSGASGYLNKSRAADELLAAVKKVLQGGKYVTASLAEKLAAALGGEVPQALHEALSHRELQVLRLVASGNSIKQIATELALSEKTVATYRSRVSKKLALGTNVELARYALKHRLVE